ncbi:unnamed protein product [Paramecium octaurelia]|uniref:Uncharacterized protein n=1 Tax=Paramecium octaurelia TaxID=43137 RepID=A0A8S1YEU2_PAROT|nr:unnamed protein product [Paramecium octaurelia]
MSELIPDYREYDDEYERYLQKLGSGPFLYDITMTEAKEYIYNDVITPKLIQYTLLYIKTQVRRNVTVEITYIMDIKQLEAIHSTTSNYSLAVTAIKDAPLSAFLLDTVGQEILLINRNQQIEKAFMNQKIIRIDSLTNDFISILAGIFIRAINHANFKLNFSECQRQALMKWVLLKQYRYQQMKQNGESFSRILDDQLLQEVNQSRKNEQKSNSHQTSQREQYQKQDNFSQLKSISQLQSSFNPQSKPPQYSQRQGSNYTSLSHVSLPSASKVDIMKNHISAKEFVQGMETLKSQLLSDVPQPDELKPRDYTLKPIIPFFPPDEVFHIRQDDLEELLKEQVKNRKIPEPNPADQLQQLLTYYQQYNPEQYKILLNQYQDFIHERMFEGMGLPSSTKSKMQVQPQFQQQQMRQSIQIPKSKSMLFPKQPQIQPQLYQEEIIAIKYNKKINRQEFELLKQKSVLSQNMMEFYFCHLQEEFKRVFIFPIEFYNVLSQNPEKAKSFTDQFQGRNRTIFDLFDKVFVPAKVSQYEYVGVYIDFQNKTMFYINTLERRDRKGPPYKELIDQPDMHFIIKFMENEYNLKVMRAFNILNWKFVEFKNEFAQHFNYSGLVLTYVIDSICNHKSAVGDDQILKEFKQKLLDAIRKAGSKK